MNTVKDLRQQRVRFVHLTPCPLDRFFYSLGSVVGVKFDGRIAWLIKNMQNGRTWCIPHPMRFTVFYPIRKLEQSRILTDIFNRIRCHKRKSNVTLRQDSTNPTNPSRVMIFLHSRASLSWNLLAIIVVISGFVGNWAQTIDPTGFLLSPPHAGEFLYSIKFARSKVQVPVPTIFPIRLARDYLDQWPAAEQFPL